MKKVLSKDCTPLLAALVMLDGALTVYGIQMGWLVELNPLTRDAYGSWLGSGMLLKVVVATMLLSLRGHINLHGAKYLPLFWGLTGIYLVVMGLHIVGLLGVR